MKALLLAATIGAAATAAPAATTYYSDLTSFATATNNMAGFTIENFEGAQPASPFFFYSWGYVAEFTGDSTVYTHEQDNMPGTNPVADGNGALWINDDGTGFLDIYLDAPVTAFSLYLSSSDAQPVLLFSNGGWNTTAATGTTDPVFFGAISDTPFDFISISAGRLADVGIDYMKFGSVAAVPLPASGLLLLAGLGAMGLRRRRTR
jgi:hypothetical protein